MSKWETWGKKYSAGVLDAVARAMYEDWCKEKKQRVQDYCIGVEAMQEAMRYTLCVTDKDEQVLDKLATRLMKERKE